MVKLSWEVKVLFNGWKYNRYRLPPWLRVVIGAIEVACLPIVIFQGIRTLFFPTPFDIILFMVMITLYIAFLRRWI